MKLESMRGTVAKYAETISSVLGVSVTVVDESLNRICDTHPYPNEPEPVRPNSILGQAVLTGTPKAERCVKESDICRTCENYDNCKLEGVIAVPILFEQTVLGGFCLIVPAGRLDLLDDAQTSVVFLENMAELFSEKMKSALQLETIKQAYREREVIMNAIEDALVSTDASGKIDYFNEMFEVQFGGKKSSIGRKIQDVVSQPVITKMLESPRDTNSHLFYHKNTVRDTSFYGFAYCYPKSLEDPGAGMLFAFRNLNNINSALSEIYIHKAGIDFDLLAERCPGSGSVLVRAKQLAITSETILIQGEHGVGRESLAKAIHNFSDRSDQYFITVQCETTTPEALETEIFGIDAATGRSAGIGHMRLAHKGTLFFDNINVMPIYLQEKLANFMKGKTQNHLSVEDVQIDVRLLFGSSEDLRELVERGHLSESLYYRISKNELRMPALRKRPEPERRAVIINVINFYAKKYEKKGIVFEEDAIQELLAHDWPGNFHDLWCCIDRLIYACNGRVTTEDVATLGFSWGMRKVKAIDVIEQEQISVLLQSGYRKDDIAKMLNISRATLYRKLKKYNIAMSN